ncbi:variable surface protein [Plasmodium gonderi]|uniref:Variable surface protein n=1 Tax=Plasmodium gonderi TaxID=77519 RepID=A0A1Y1JVT1_PLAGO|nr:variable surface protein [Plasmodium gonderi]GAW83994.1 variable surface protein [Plasmodium gonderi]
MDLQVSSYTLDMFAQENSTFKEYVLYKLYNYYFDVSCKGYDTEIYCPTVDYYKFDDEEIEEFYNKIIRNLNGILSKDQKINDIIDNEDKLCTYLKYWFHDKIISKGYKDPQIKMIYDAWENTKNTLNVKSPCRIFRLDLSKTIEIKPMFDYFILYDRKKKEKEESDEILESKYCNYFKEAHIMYIFKELKCISNNKFPLCNEFNEYIKKHIEYKEDMSFSCDTKNEAQDDFNHPDLATYNREETKWFNELQIDHKRTQFVIISKVGKATKIIIIVFTFSFFCILSLLLLFSKVNKINAYYSTLGSYYYNKILNSINNIKNKILDARKPFINSYVCQDMHDYVSRYNILYSSY